MFLPIYLYGMPVLRKQAESISADYPGLQTLIENMYDTMYQSDGIGLAAPQVGLGIRLLVIDASPMADLYPECKDFKRTMINPQIISRDGSEISCEEGCLSLPGIHEKVLRPDRIAIRYCDSDFQEREESLEGFAARVVQHEYDHLEGHLFIDHLSPIRKQLIKSKLNNIIKGKVRCDYRVKSLSSHR